MPVIQKKQFNFSGSDLNIGQTTVSGGYSGGYYSINQNMSIPNAFGTISSEQKTFSASLATEIAALSSSNVTQWSGSGFTISRTGDVDVTGSVTVTNTVKAETLMTSSIGDFYRFSASLAIIKDTLTAPTLSVSVNITGSALNTLRQYVNDKVVLVASSESAPSVRDAAQYLCDGTGDQVQITQAINFVSSGSRRRGVVVLSEGVFNLTDTMGPEYSSSIFINSGSDLVIVGQGTNTILKKANNLTAHAFKIMNSSDVVLEKFAIDGNRTGSATHGGLFINNCDRVTQRDIHIYEVTTHPFGYYSSRDVQVIGCFGYDCDSSHGFDIDRDVEFYPTVKSERITFTHCKGWEHDFTAIKAENCSDIIITNCVFSQSAGKDACIDISINDVNHTGVENVIVSNNIFLGADSNFIQKRTGKIGFYNNLFYNSQFKIGNNGGDVDFIGNTIIQRDVNIGFQLDSTITGSHHFNISNNHFFAPDSSGESKVIDINTVTSSVIFKDNTIKNFRNTGILIANQKQNVVIDGNFIRSAGAENGYTGNLIAIEVENTGSIVSNNIIEKCKFGIRLDGATDTYVHGNHMYGYVGASQGIVEIGNADNNFIVNNKIDDVGSINNRLIIAGANTVHRFNIGTRDEDDLDITHLTASNLAVSTKYTGSALNTLRNYIHENIIVVASSESSPGVKDSADFICDGTADQIQLIQAANILQSGSSQGRGTLQLTRGTYNITPNFAGASIVWSNLSNVNIRGDGFGTVIKVANSQNTNAVRLFNCNNIKISDLTVDGNKENNTSGGGFIVSDSDQVTLNNLNIRHGRSQGLRILSSRDIVVNDCYVHDIHGGYGVYVDRDSTYAATSASQRIVVSNCIVKNAGSGLVKVQNSQHVSFEDNIMKQTDGTASIVIDNTDTTELGTYNIDFSDNIVVGGNSVTIGRNTGLVKFSNNLLSGSQVIINSNDGDVDFIGNNLIQRDVNIGIQINPIVSGSAQVIRIIGNYIKSPDTATESKTIDVNAISGTILIKDNVIKNFRNKGIQVQNKTGSHVIIEGNYFRSSGPDNGWTGNLMAIELQKDFVVVKNNEIDSCLKGIHLNVSSGSVIQNNHFYGYTGSDFFVSEQIGASGSYIFDNVIEDMYPRNLRIAISSGSNTILRNNIGYTTTNQGIATIPATTSSIAVDANLDFTFVSNSLNRVHVTPRTSLSNGKYFWIEYQNSNGFRIVVAEAVSSSVDFNWKVLDN